MEDAEQVPQGFVLKDGSLHRLPAPIPFENPDFVDGVASKDVVLDPSSNSWVRLYRSQEVDTEEKRKKRLLTVFVYFHGGGFVYGTPAYFQRLCREVSKRARAIVVSVNYKLAPEHRLPAAYEDGFSALRWLDSCSKGDVKEAWLEDANFSRVFISGDSAGGNLAHHVTLRAVQEPELLSGIQLLGQLLLQPFFGGVARTKSELELGNGALFTLSFADICWKLALPEGENRDHEFCNPGLKLREKLTKGFVGKSLVVAGGLDLLKDRQVEYAKILEEAGMNVKLVVYEKANHGFYTTECEETELLLGEIVGF